MPQGGETWQGETLRAHRSPDPGRATEPPQRRARYSEKPTSAPDPRHLSADIQTQARGFPGQRQARSYPGLQSLGTEQAQV